MEEIKEIANVINVIMDAADKQREKSKDYKDLFAKDDVESLLREMEYQMMHIVVNGASVLKKKFGFSFSNEDGHTGNEAYSLLLGLPLLENKIEKKIKNTEGFSCCVDKTFFLLGKTLKALGIKK